MPSISIPITEEKIKLRWREKYLTEGANERSSAIVRGAYRGFYFAPSAVPDKSLWLVIDPFSPAKELDPDQFAVYNAKDDSGNAYAVSIRETVNVELDLSTIWPVGVDTLYVYIEASYAQGSTTTGAYNVSDEDPHDPGSTNYNPYAVVLGAIKAYDFSTGDLDFDPESPSVMPVWYSDRSTPQPTWVDDDLFDGGYEKGDEQWGLVSGFERRNFPTADEKDAMTNADAPSAANPFMTLTGGGTMLAPLIVDVTAYLPGADHNAIEGYAKGTGTGISGWGGSNSGRGGYFDGGDASVVDTDGGPGVFGIGGEGDGTGRGGAGGEFYGGPKGLTGVGGPGVWSKGGDPDGAGLVGIGFGASYTYAPINEGVIGVGGDSNGIGGRFTGGDGLGIGVFAQGGESASQGGVGLDARGGSPGTTGHGGVGVAATGGDGIGVAPYNGGLGINAYGGAPGGGNPGSGVKGTGNVAGGSGVIGIGGGGSYVAAPDYEGVIGVGGGTDGHGVVGYGEGDGNGVVALGEGALHPGGSESNGTGLVAVGETPNGTAIYAAGGDGGGDAILAIGDDHTTSGGKGGKFWGGSSGGANTGAQGIWVVGGEGAGTGDGGAGGQFYGGNASDGSAYSGTGVVGIGGIGSGYPGCGVLGRGGNSSTVSLLDIYGVGVYGVGENSSLPSPGGVFDGGASSGSNKGGNGVNGWGGNSASGDGGTGVYGRGGYPDGAGVHGNGRGDGCGGYFESDTGDAIWGIVDSGPTPTPGGAAIWGSHGGAFPATGVVGRCDAGYGLTGITYTGIGAAFSAVSTGCPLRIVPKTSDPTTNAYDGCFYYNGSTKKLRFHNGTGWNDV